MNGIAHILKSQINTFTCKILLLLLLFFSLSLSINLIEINYSEKETHSTIYNINAKGTATSCVLNKNISEQDKIEIKRHTITRSIYKNTNACCHFSSELKLSYNFPVIKKNGSIKYHRIELLSEP